MKINIVKVVGNKKILRGYVSRLRKFLFIKKNAKTYHKLRQRVTKDLQKNKQIKKIRMVQQGHTELT